MSGVVVIMWEIEGRVWKVLDNIATGGSASTSRLDEPIPQRLGLWTTLDPLLLTRFTTRGFTHLSFCRKKLLGKLNS